MFRTITFNIKQGDLLYDYCDSSAKAVNNLRNATLFRIRQVLTFTNKPEEQWSQNEIEIYNEIKSALPAMGEKYKMPTQKKPFLSYEFLNALMYVTKNPDYFNEAITHQLAEDTIKATVREMKSYYAGKREYKKNPTKFTGEPHIPHYGKKGGCRTIEMNNQDCVIYNSSKGGCEVKLPRAKDRFYINNAPKNGRLKKATITPTHGIFILALTFDDGIDETTIQKRESRRICAIDLGVNNLAAITNNIGAPCLLLKGKIIKSINRYYNKTYADIQSKQMKATGQKFHATPESDKICLWRNHQINDFLDKTASYIIKWCTAYDIDTIVIGATPFWKQEVNIGDINNQNFVEIPFYKFRKAIKWRADRLGINVVEIEESYTSKASFLSNDPIPTYVKGDKTKYEFSGYRESRGIYKIKGGGRINADLNGSANILRKAFPDAFSFEGACLPDFNNVIVINHPDEALIKHNKEVQIAKADSKLTEEERKTKQLKQQNKQKAKEERLLAKKEREKAKRKAKRKRRKHKR